MIGWNMQAEKQPAIDSDVLRYKSIGLRIESKYSLVEWPVTGSVTPQRALIHSRSIKKISLVEQL
jgi:hypothetical protein